MGPDGSCTVSVLYHQGDKQSSYFQVHDGPGPVSELIERICGNSHPSTVTSSSNQMWVSLTSETGINASTFSATVTGVVCKYSSCLLLEIHKNLSIPPLHIEEK
jgi:hypothetical protein